MQNFQPQPADAPLDDDPGSLPGPDTATEAHPAPTEPNTDPPPHPTRQNHNAEVDFWGVQQSNANQASSADPNESLYKKSPGTGAVLCFTGQALMENRACLIVQNDLTQANGHAERCAASDIVHRHSPGSTRQLTMGADMG